MPKYDLDDWVSWKRIVNRESKICTECGHTTYGPSIKTLVSGKILTIFSTISKTKCSISYCVRVDLETSVVQMYVAEEDIVESWKE